jgi:hypothetical protein
MSRLQRAASAAVDTLERIATNEKAPATSQGQAATKILEFAYRADRLADIEALLDELLKDEQ